MVTLKQQIDTLKEEVDYLRGQLTHPQYQTRVRVSKKESLLNYLGKSQAFKEFLMKIPDDDTNYLDNCEWDFTYHPLNREKISKGNIVVDKKLGTVSQEVNYDNTNWDAREKIAERTRGCAFVKEVRPNGVVEYYYTD